MWRNKTPYPVPSRGQPLGGACFSGAGPVTMAQTVARRRTVAQTNRSRKRVPEDVGGVPASLNDRKRPTVPFVQCAAGGSSVPSGWDWLFRLTVAKFRMPGCSVWSIYEVSSR